MEFDVVIVGAGPAGLSTACRLMQKSQQEKRELSICVIEKGSEIGAHIFSGAVFETRALDELFPDWKEKGAPLTTPVTEDEIYLLKNAEKAQKIPNSFVPKTMHNEGNYIISVGNLCRWLGEQAESLGVEIFPGFSASEILYDEQGAVKGVLTGDMGIAKNGEQRSDYMPGMELHAKYTVFSEGCRGHLGKQLIEKYSLDKDSDVQHYGIGIKELWNIDPSKHKPGLVVHGAGWPLDKKTNGGSFLYHAENNQVMVGIVIDLSYSNPYLSPFDEFQRMKHHPLFKGTLEGGTRVSYGARAIAKGGLNSLPKMCFPGGLLIGCDAGTLNFAKIKGTHTAMKSGLLAAESIFDALISPVPVSNELTSFTDAFAHSWIYEELHQTRNFGPAMHKYGTFFGGAFNYLDQNWFKGKLPFTLHDTKPDHEQLKPAADSIAIEYAKPDNKISFDKLSSVFISNTNHEENQPCHLRLKSQIIPLETNLAVFAGPEARFCPAGVYEFIEDAQQNKTHLQINAQNCLHCKTCDIKDPTQNITWQVPEGAGGPSYPNM
jgi:electron-transferring-flavoprotein dehydrogenase